MRCIFNQVWPCYESVRAGWGCAELLFLNADGAVFVLGQIGRELCCYGGGVGVGDGRPRGGRFVEFDRLIGVQALEPLET